MGGRASRPPPLPPPLDPTNLSSADPPPAVPSSPQAWSGPPLPNRYLASSPLPAVPHAEDEVTEWTADAASHRDSAADDGAKEATDAPTSLTALANRYKAEEKTPGHHAKKKSAIVQMTKASSPPKAAAVQKPPGAVGGDDEDGVDDSALDFLHGSSSRGPSGPSSRIGASSQSQQSRRPLKAAVLDNEMFEQDF